MMSHASLIRERKEKASAIAREVHGGAIVQLDLGKKVSLPQDLMMEELSLLANKGSKMFQMRQKRVDKFTVEGVRGAPARSGLGGMNAAGHPGPGHMNADGMKENYRSEVHVAHPGKQSGPAVAPKPFGRLSAAKNINVVLNPNIIAPGYSSPLKEIPAEKFNVTAIPRSYHSPWADTLGYQDHLIDVMINQLPEAPPDTKPQTYRCFNRAAIPFGGCGRLFAVPDLESMEMPEEAVAPDVGRLTNRPSFNRRARGWTGPPLPESDEL
ncbi:myozenin-2-like [Rhinoraja longicauda]